jgi:hypothetical protein
MAIKRDYIRQGTVSDPTITPVSPVVSEPPPAVVQVVNDELAKPQPEPTVEASASNMTLEPPKEPDVTPAAHTAVNYAGFTVSATADSLTIAVAESANEKASRPLQYVLERSGGQKIIVVIAAAADDEQLPPTLPDPPVVPTEAVETAVAAPETRSES